MRPTYFADGWRPESHKANTMTTTSNSGPEYLHGTDEPEQARAEALAKILGGAEFLPPLTPGRRILEVGCGTGSIAREVAVKVAPAEVIAIDREEVQLRTARRLAANQGLANLRFQQGDAANLHLLDAQFDGVYCRFVLKHVASPLEVVREMVRVVRPGGWVCAFEWERGCSLHYPETPAIEEVWRALYDLQADGGKHPWIARSLYEVMLRAGLRQVNAEGRGWSITAGQKDKLHAYVDGAREIIGQVRDRLLSEHRVTAETLQEADDEYRRMLQSTTAFVMGGYVCATGTKVNRP